MSKIKKHLLCLLSGVSLLTNAYAQTEDFNDYALMTARDMRDSALSNITVTNRAGQPVSVAGLFIQSFDINDCSACFGGLVAGDNVAASIISPVNFKINQTVPIGQNYLYNMLYNGMYYLSTVVGTPCALPGCSWPGDNPTVRGWCININLISMNSSYTYSHFTNGSRQAANSPPYGAASVSIPFDYKYALINPMTLGVGRACLGPVVCNDKTLTCKVNQPQNTTFQPYR